MVTIQSLFGLAGRQTEGFVESIFQLMDLDLPIPDHSTVSRRLQKLSVQLPVIPSNEAIHLVVDSLLGKSLWGRGMENQSSWFSRKRRTWRKLHLGVNEATGEIVSGVVTTNDISDDQVFSDLLDGVDGCVVQVSGDGAYDKYKCYEKARQQGVKATIPPRKNAVIGQHGNCKSPPHPRDENLRRIRIVGRQKWKRESGYHARLLIGNYNVQAQSPLWREVTTTKI